MSQLAFVVDDSMLIRHAVCRFFEERDFAVESATSGAEALEMLGHLSPAVIITDLKMPKMDGYELMAALKARPDTAHIPIVVLSSNQTPENRLLKTAKHIIFKDIDIEVQLQRVLDSLFPERAAELAKSKRRLG